MKRRQLLGWSGGILSGAGCGRREPALAGAGGAARWTQSVYVWQRKWTLAVASAVRGAAGRFDLICYLAGEREHPRGETAGEWRWVKPDWDALKAAGAGIAAAVRMEVPRGNLQAEVEVLKSVRARVVAEAAGHGVALQEIHLDVDCPRSRLREYEGLMRALSGSGSVGRTASVPWVITVLPDWLGEAAFVDLAAAAGAFVLQVHALTLPGVGIREAVMCEARQAVAWVQQAGKAGVPYRVALPTYASRVFYDAAGTVLDVAGEDGAEDGPAGTERHCLVRTDAAAMAALVRAWQEARPRGATGLIWYRLPVAGDCWNWSASALADVMAGRAPAAEVRVKTRRHEAGFYELTARNHGGVEAQLPQVVTISGPGGSKPVAWDFHGDWQGQIERGDLKIRNSGGWLFPAQALRLGWVRLSRPGEPVLTLLP